jgi:hypothetical protein
MTLQHLPSRLPTHSLHSHTSHHKTERYVGLDTPQPTQTNHHTRHPPLPLTPISWTQRPTSRQTSEAIAISSATHCPYPTPSAIPHDVINCSPPAPLTHKLSPIPTPQENIAFQLTTLPSNSPTNLTKYLITRLYGTHNVSNTHHIVITQAQQPNECHLKTHRPTNSTPNQKHNHSPGTTHLLITDPDTHITRTPKTDKPTYRNRALLRQTKCITDTYTHQNHMGGNTPSASRKRKAKTHINTTIPH